MTNKICGHERNMLKLVLKEYDADQSTVDGDMWAYVMAHDALNDPTKLAAMIAEDARRCGLRCAVVDISTHEMQGNDLTVRVGSAPLVLTYSRGEDVRFCAMPQARAILAKLLQLPDDARKEAERVLRGEP